MGWQIETGPRVVGVTCKASDKVPMRGVAVPAVKDRKGVGVQVGLKDDARKACLLSDLSGGIT